MKTSKKWLVLTLAFTMLCLLTACGNDNKANGNVNGATPVRITPVITRNRMARQIQTALQPIVQQAQAQTTPQTMTIL